MQPRPERNDREAVDANEYHDQEELVGNDNGEGDTDMDTDAEAEPFLREQRQRNAALRRDGVRTE